jgi:hypothetical protein
MAKAWRGILQRLEAEAEKRKDWEEKHPPITRMKLIEADDKRRISFVGEKCVACDLPCCGNHIPTEYGHTGYLVNVFHADISFKGWENPSEGDAAYFGVTCDLAEGKICVATDEILRKVVER